MGGRKLFILAAALGSIAGPNSAEENSQPKRPPDALLPVTAIEYREAYISMIMSVLRQGAQDHKTLTSGDVERKKGIDKASRTSNIMAQFFKLDVNGDRFVDAQEVGRPRQENAQMSPKPGLLVADTNGDGKVSLDEALAYASQSDEPLSNRSTNQLENFLALDPNGDGMLTADELQNLATATFSYFDKDSDGVISPTEKQELQAQLGMILRTDTLRRQMAPCRFPKALPQQKVYLVTAYESGTLSNVSVAGQDEETETATIEIAAGSEPIYLAVSSYTPIIWRLTGHVERVTTFHGSGVAGVGVTGVSKDVATLIPGRECIPRIEGTSTGPAQLQSLASLIDHDIDGIVSRYTSFNLTLPVEFRPIKDVIDKDRSAKQPDFSLDGLPSQNGILRFKRAIDSLERFSPGGVVNIDPKSVIATRVAEKYEVLPQEAGLLQLLQDGSLADRGLSYVAMKPFARYPAGLAGSHSVTFQFPEGMKLPEGNPGHSRVRVGNAEMSPVLKRGLLRP